MPHPDQEADSVQRRTVVVDGNGGDLRSLDQFAGGDSRIPFRKFGELFGLHGGVQEDGSVYQLPLGHIDELFFHGGIAVGRGDYGMIPCRKGSYLDPLDHPGVKLVGDGGKHHQDLHGLQPPQRPAQEVWVIVQLFNGVLDLLCRFSPDVIIVVEDPGYRRYRNTGPLCDILDGGHETPPLQTLKRRVIVYDNHNP